MSAMGGMWTFNSAPAFESFRSDQSDAGSPNYAVRFGAGNPSVGRAS